MKYKKKVSYLLQPIDLLFIKNKICCKTIFLAIILSLLIVSNASPDANSSFLNRTEQTWLNEHNEIIFVSQTEYPPFEFINEDYQSEGMCIELAYWIATEFGFKIRVRHMPFFEAQDAVITGKADVLTSLFYSEKRDDEFDFTRMTWSVPALIFVQSDRPDIKDIEDLNGKRVAIQKGDYAEDFLDSQNILYSVISTKTFAESINMLITGQADAIIGDKQIVLYNLCSNQLLDKVKSVGEPLYIGQNSMAVKEGNQILQSILNKGLKRAQDSEVFSKLTMKWIGTRYSNAPHRLKRFLPLIISGIGILGIIFILISLWVLQLRRIVEKRTQELRRSELHLKSVFKAIPDLLWIKDPEGVYLNCNRRFEDFFGAIEQEIIGKTDSDFVDGNMASFFRSNDLFVMESGKSIMDEKLLKFACDGHQELLETIITPVYDHNGKISGILGVAHDITERVEAEQKLKESESFLATIIENIPNIITVKDAENLKFIRLNKAVETILGYCRDDMIGKNDYDLNSLERAEISIAKNREILKEGVPVDFFEEKVYTKTGETRILHTKKIPIYNNSEKPQYLLRISEDITERKKIENQLAQTQKMESIGQLAGGIAHNFNNILCGIMGAAQLLQLPQMNLDERGRKYSDMILKASEKGSDLIGKLMTFGQKDSISISFIDLNEILNDAIELLYGTMDKNIPISLTANAVNRTVRGDRSGLENVIINLCINAGHAIENVGEIHITTENIEIDQFYCSHSSFNIQAGEYCKIDVKDTGIGIPPENIKKIFDPFFTTKEQGKGTGLGLSAIYGIIQEHNGEILVESKIGQGTTFSIVLPCSTEEMEISREDNQVKKGFGTILLVDDEELNRTFGSEILEHLGYTVILAENGQESLKIFTEKHKDIDIVILDMIMPIMNGAETFTRMKEIDENCKAIMSSGYSQNRNIDSLIKKGLSGFIYKPYKISEISQLIDSIHKK